MTRAINFSAGPAALPEEVLQQAAAEMLDWHGSGQSVMEMSHRGKEFMAIAAAAEADLRELMAIPANYKVLFLQGGASLQFEMIPMNLLNEKRSVDVVHTGQWAAKAIKGAKNFGKVNVVASAEDSNYTYAPVQSSWKLDPNAAYVHYTANETIGGVEFHWTPETGNVPLVCDMSSNILSKPVDVSKYGIIYAGAQKNIGPAGLTIVIIRDDLIGIGQPPSAMLDFKTHADNDSMYNTPPTYGIYIAGLVFQWLKKQGGLASIEQKNIAKANLLYNFLDQSTFFKNPVKKEDRSRMNIPFTLANAELDEEFLKGAKERGMVQLKGHRSVGGMRASIYNAMPMAGVEALVAYMKEFEAKHGQ